MAPPSRLLLLLIHYAAGSNPPTTMMPSAMASPAGNVACWGASPESTVPGDLGPVVELVAGGHVTCVRTAAQPGRPRCWGDADVGDTVAVPAHLVDVERLYVGGWHACARRQGGSVECWGQSSEGPMDFDVGVVEELSVSWYTVLAVKNGTVECFGYETYGQCTVPGDLGAGVRSVAAGGHHSCAALQDGSVRCWGATSDSHASVQVPAGLTGVTKLWAGGYDTCALKEDGTYVCWGSRGGSRTSHEPVIVGGDTFCKMSGGQVHDCWGRTKAVRDGAEAQGEVLVLALGGGHGCALLPTTTTTSTMSTATVTTSSSSSSTPSSTMSSTVTATDTQSSTTSGTSTSTSSATATATDTSTATATVTETSTATDTATDTSTVTATATATDTGTTTATVTDTSTATATDTSTATATDTSTATATATATATPSSTAAFETVTTSQVAKESSSSSGSWGQSSSGPGDALSWGSLASSSHGGKAAELSSSAAAMTSGSTSSPVASMSADVTASSSGPIDTGREDAGPHTTSADSSTGDLPDDTTAALGLNRESASTTAGLPSSGGPSGTTSEDAGLSSSTPGDLLDVSTTASGGLSSRANKEEGSSSTSADSSTNDLLDDAITALDLNSYSSVLATAGLPGSSYSSEGDTNSSSAPAVAPTTGSIFHSSAAFATSTGAPVASRLPGTLTAVPDPSSTDADSGTKSTSAFTRMSARHAAVAQGTEVASNGVSTSLFSANVSDAAAALGAASSIGSTSSADGSSADESTVGSSFSSADGSTAASSSSLPLGAVSTTIAPARAKAQAVTRAIVESLSALRSANTTTVRLNTALGAVTIVDLNAAAASPDKPAVFTPVEGGKVLLPPALLQALPRDSILSILSVDGNESGGSLPEGDAFAELGDLASTVLDISIVDQDGRPVVTELAAPLLFRLPDAPAALGGEPQCVFLETRGSGQPFWSRKGVWRASAAEVAASGQDPRGTWCFTKHLSIFAALVSLVLGCTNLELLSQSAIKGLAENEGWHRAESAVAVFAVWGFLAGAMLLGNLWERWSLRLGRTHGSGKAVNICKKFMNWGPQVLKHKYVAFLVYARDLLHCFRAGRHKLKGTSLTSSVQRFLAVRTGISVACVTQHCWNSGGWIEPKASLPRTVLCRKLEFHAGRADRVVEEDVLARGPLGVLRRFVLTVLAVHPLLDAMRLGAGSLSVAKRVTLQCAGLCGVMATNALIFNFSGSMRSWEADAECPIDPTSNLFILVATVVSITVNALPNAFLMDLAKQVHGRPFWTLVFWASTLSYLAFACFLVLAILANLNAKDAGKWHKSLEWGVSIKFVGMPLAQGLRNLILLEAFLWEDRRCAPEMRFQVAMGLTHPNEVELSKEEQDQVAADAAHSISAEELLSFVKLLGDKATECTSAEVLRGAVTGLCAKPSSLEDFPVQVEVLEIAGHRGGDPLRCSVLHLGRMQRSERPCLSEQQGQCGMAVSVSGLDREHALGFTVSSGGSLLGMACIGMEELLAAGGWQGRLHLQRVTEGWSCSEAAPVRYQNVRASGGARTASLAMEVRVRLSAGHGQAVADRGLEFLLPRSEAAKAGGELPPATKLVVHSRQGSFLHLVTCVVADALGPGSHKDVRDAMLSKDYDTVMEMLRESGLHGTRYWIDLFSADPHQQQRSDQEGGLGWHEGYLASWPVMLRALRRSWCQVAVAEIRAGWSTRDLPKPPSQLLVLDDDLHLLQDFNCLAEVMLAKAMRMKQELIMDPVQAHKADLSDALRRMAQKLELGENAMAHTSVYLQDRRAVYEALRELAIAGAREHRPDEPEISTWKELGDVAAVAAAVEVGRERSTSGRADVDLDDLEVGGDVDVDV